MYYLECLGYRIADINENTSKYNFDFSNNDAVCNELSYRKGAVAALIESQGAEALLNRYKLIEEEQDEAA